MSELGRIIQFWDPRIMGAETRVYKFKANFDYKVSSKPFRVPGKSLSRKEKGRGREWVEPRVLVGLKYYRSKIKHILIRSHGCQMECTDRKQKN